MEEVIAVATEPTPTLTNQEIVRAATNAPELSESEFMLGGRKFKVIDLDYDNYLTFCTKLEPLLKGVFAKLSGKANVTIPGITLEEPSLLGIVNFCKGDLPEMAAIVCNMQSVVNEDIDASVDAEWVKKHAKSPIQLANIVVAQINQNSIIQEFASFFAQMLPAIMAISNKPAESKT